MVQVNDANRTSNRNFQGIIHSSNSDVVKHTLISLITVATSKTSKVYARATLKMLLEKLVDEYDFIKHITIEETGKVEDNKEAVTVLTDVDYIKSEEVGQVIQNLIDIYRRELGEKAGYFFIREFRYVLGDDYHSIIKKWGVDLRISEIQDDIYGWDSEKYHIKDDEDTNIAFIEKK